MIKFPRLQEYSAENTVFPRVFRPAICGYMRLQMHKPATMQRYPRLKTTYPQHTLDTGKLENDEYSGRRVTEEDLLRFDSFKS